ncbi:hypothetical protein VU03_03750, partial [Desulfobulbus sp. N3]|nr:hypothetical protein [Desulfobulbus sp. N3]
TGNHRVKDLLLHIRLNNRSLIDNEQGYIVENAVSFHTPDTAIELQLEQHEDNNISLLVINQGPIIEPDMQQQIFHSMISSRTVKDKSPHLGLGLYIVRTVLDHHDGRVNVQNLADGRSGVVFTITLPCVPSNELTTE